MCTMALLALLPNTSDKPFKTQFSEFRKYTFHLLRHQMHRGLSST